MKQLLLTVLALCALAAPATRAADANKGLPICLTLPRVAVGDDAAIINAFSARLRKQIATTLAGPLVEPRGVDSHLAIQARAEASNLKCHYLLNVSFRHVPNSRIGRRTAQTALSVGRVAQSVGGLDKGKDALGAASSLGGLLGSSSGGGNRAPAGQGFYPLGKSDLVELAWSLELVDATVVVRKAELAGKVSRDNEPLLDTYVEKLAEEVLLAVSN